MKKAYHAACKEEKLATSRESNSKLESNNNPETLKKLQEKVEKCQQEVQKVGSSCMYLKKILKWFCFSQAECEGHHTRKEIHQKKREFYENKLFEKNQHFMRPK